MRTTITFEPDVEALVDELRRREGIGVSEAVNRLVRSGAASRPGRTPYVHRSADVGVTIDVSNIAEVLDMLDDA